MLKRVPYPQILSFFLSLKAKSEASGHLRPSALDCHSQLLRQLPSLTCNSEMAPLPPRQLAAAAAQSQRRHQAAAVVAAVVAAEALRAAPRARLARSSPHTVAASVLVLVVAVASDAMSSVRTLAQRLPDLQRQSPLMRPTMPTQRQTGCRGGEAEVLA